MGPCQGRSTPYGSGWFNPTFSRNPYNRYIYSIPNYWVIRPSPFFLGKNGEFTHVLIGKDFLFGGFLHPKTKDKQVASIWPLETCGKNVITHWPTVYHCIVLYGHTFVSSKHSLHKKSIEEKHPYGHITGPYGWKEARFHVTFRKYGPT